MNKWVMSIGLEIHTTIKTKRKAFSTSANVNDAAPNTNVDYIDLALPGTLPILNFAVIEKAIQLGHSLNARVNYQNITFDRKNYYYFDIPKSFQITQHFNPIAVEGTIKLFDDTEIIIKSIQIEEDTAKQTTDITQQYILLDYNRVSCPLLEIITLPTFESTEQVMDFLTKLRRYLTFLNISDGRIEKGNFRVDLNISVRNAEKSNILGPKIEVKNIGSWSAIVEAIKYEKQRQIDLLNENQTIVSATYYWDEKLKKTIFMRQKQNTEQYFVDLSSKNLQLQEQTMSTKEYYFIPENNFPPIKLTDIEYQKIISDIQYNWRNVETELLNSKLDLPDINFLLDNFEIFKFVEKINQILNNYKITYKWIVIEIMGCLNKNNKSFDDLTTEQIENLIKMIVEVEINQTINSKQAKLIISEIINQNLTLEKIIKQHKLIQITDQQYLETLIKEIILNHSIEVKKFKNQPIKFEKFIIGKIMILTKGQANPIIAKKAYDYIAEPLLIKE